MTRPPSTDDLVVHTDQTGRQMYGRVKYVRAGLVVADWYTTPTRKGAVFQLGVELGRVDLDGRPSEGSAC